MPKKKKKPKEDKHQCYNCGETWDDSDLKVDLLCIPDLNQRLEPGGPVPSGECPDCEALVYLVEDEKALTKHIDEVLDDGEEPKPRVLIFVEDGLVNDVIADTDLEVRLIDYDVQGAEEDEVRPIPDGKGFTQEAHVSQHAVEVNAKRIEQLWPIQPTWPPPKD